MIGRGYTLEIRTGIRNGVTAINSASLDPGVKTSWKRVPYNAFVEGAVRQTFQVMGNHMVRSRVSRFSRQDPGKLVTWFVPVEKSARSLHALGARVHLVSASFRTYVSKGWTLFEESHKRLLLLKKFRPFCCVTSNTLFAHTWMSRRYFLFSYFHTLSRLFIIPCVLMNCNLLAV